MLPADTILRSRYKIIKLLGKGGFGETYLAEDLDIPTNPKPKRVVKLLSPQNRNPQVLQLAKDLFDREAEILYRLGQLSDQIPKLFAHFEEKGEFYLVQEFVDGHDLSTELTPGKQVSEAEVVKLLKDILEVLAVVHQHKIIHRDIKPQNIMRRRQDHKLVLIDFGAVKEIQGMTISQGQITSTVCIGTPGYMPNEQAKGKPNLCSDVYAVGMLGIQGLTGISPHQLPEDSTTGEVIWRQWANVGDRLAGVLTNMVRSNHGQRYQTAQEALQVLIPPPPPPPPPPPLVPRRRIIQTLGLVGAGFGLAIVVEQLLSNKSEQNSGVSDTPGFSPASSPTPKQLATSQGLSLQAFPFQTVTVDARGNITKRDNHQAKYFVEDLGNGVTLEMVQIPGGKFLMGSPPGEAGRENDEGPQREVTVPGFFMGKYEVTQAQYQAIMGNNPSNFKGEKRPVEQVSWNDAVKFCEELSKKTGRTYRLPSEAEWEYAARAGTTTPFYFGETITTDLANYDGNFTYASAPKGEYREETTDVGIFPPNSFGLYDMCGNVWEWCLDKYHNNYNEAPTNGSAWLEYGEDTRLLRGGSWYGDSRYCRSASRIRINPDDRGLDIGFRLVVLVA
ncbi:protein kinase [Fischerella thermalis CCMEE 5330]|uniref:Protein kinase n=1 Tax=Fischerella thermalis CCMEE 5330 TaxID=2019670 RepID=A0A2N6LXH3_9CYAN|nr:bifunctional serine/threonine-protein kinase/formylglycine-generating enzyme family protein [Fischerella thermalis]PMB39180.1 protein kinase [Fischerella thermalis CCMEE 5330]